MNEEKETQAMVAEGGPVNNDNQQEHIPVEVAPGTMGSEQQVNRPPSPTEPSPFKFHRPAQKKSVDIPVGKPLDAVLLENLPKRWERECYRQFRKDDHITLIGMTFFPGIGALYEFEEGKRGSFCVRPDQVSISDTEVPQVESVVSEHVEVYQGVDPQGGTNGGQEEIIPSPSNSPSDGVD